MGLTISEVARLLGVTENVVRGHIATGKLAFDVLGGQVVIPEAAVEALLHPGQRPFPAHSGGATAAGRPAQEEVLRSVLKELFAIQEQLDNKWGLVNENQRLQQLLRDKDRELAERNAEIDRLKRVATIHREIADKDLEDRERSLAEKLSMLEEQTARRLAREQEMCREHAARLEEQWARRLAEERERFARDMAEAQRREGFWARLVKMMTWS
jgi:excisionase family DNA binding protein